jgi:hypothetical protein
VIALDDDGLLALLTFFGTARDGGGPFENGSVACTGSQPTVA